MQRGRVFDDGERAILRLFRKFPVNQEALRLLVVFLLDI